VENHKKTEKSDFATASEEVSRIKHRFFTVCLSLALAVALFTGVFAVMGWGSLLRDVGSTIVYPFQRLAAGVGDAVAGFTAYFADIRDLREENQALREEIRDLQQQLTDAEILADENGWLYRYLSMKEEHGDYTLCGATVIASASSVGEGGVHVTEITLNRGTSSGVQAGMPVVTALGLVGVVVDAEANHCRVSTVLDTSVSVGAVTTRGAEHGLCEGDYSLVHDGLAVLRYMDEEADVLDEDIAVTSGRGSVYPYGIPIGRVTSVSYNAYSRTTEAVIRPFVDFSDLRHVTVMTSFIHYTDGLETGEETS
jgi:rod shape-determining protein MreC